MLIRKLVLENFGLYRGRNEILLTPQVKYGRRRPVVLIGGKNGAGKTTLLEALRLCLYGSLSLGGRIGNREYDSYLRARIHRADSILIQPQSAAVGLEFEYAHEGKIQTYSVERRWDVVDGALKLSLSVLRDDQLLEGLDRHHADEFLRDLIPQGVSQLYFFDGEKIQQLAESDNDDEALATAIRELLGLDLVDTLRSDLRVYFGRLDDLQSTDPLQRELQSIIEERLNVQQQLFDARRHLDECQSTLDNLHRDEAKEEQRLSRKGGAFASQRESLKAERAQLTENLKAVEAEIRTLSEGLLPFVLCSELCKRLHSQLLAEQDVTSWDSHKRLLEGRVKQLKKTALTGLIPPGIELKKFEQKRIVEKFVELLEGLTDPPDTLPQVASIHRFSVDQSRRLLGAVDRVVNDVPKQIRECQDQLEALTRRIRETEHAEQQVPEKDELGAMLERIQEIRSQVPNAVAARTRASDEVDRLERRLSELDRSEAKLNDKLDGVQQHFGRRQMVSKVQGVLEQYTAALTKTRTNQLSEAISRRFGELWRKGDVIRRIEVNPDTFEVTLFDRHERKVRKQELSAGEKQMYAISLLWALADISGRPLPMIIDTPLGRLDSEHRSHLVQRYFPNASHQVVILSTDTEVDRSYFQELSPSLSHSYCIEYDGADERSVLTEGYFWGRREEEMSHASE